MKTTEDTKTEASGNISKIKLGLGNFFIKSLKNHSATPTKSWSWAKELET